MDKDGVSEGTLGCWVGDWMRLVGGDGVDWIEDELTLNNSGKKISDGGYPCLLVPPNLFLGKKGISGHRKPYDVS